MTFLQKVLDRTGTPFFILTIDSIGDAGGLFKFATRRPSRYAGSGTYLLLFQARPHIEPERMNPLGGVGEQSELTIELVDVDDVLTSLFRTFAEPRTRLTADIASSSSPVALDSALGIVPGQSVLHVGREAMVVTALVGANATVTRGALGTDARAALAADPVYLFTTSLYGRRMRLYVAFDDEEYSAPLELTGELGGGWAIDTIELGDQLQTWRLQGRSQLKHLDRLLYRIAFRGALQLGPLGSVVLHTQPFDGQSAAREVDGHYGDRIFLEVAGHEIVRVDPNLVGAGDVRIERRAVGGTRLEEWRQDDEVRQVFLADREDGYGSFRYESPGAEGTNAWTVTDHPVPILLALLLSPSGVDAPLHANYVAGQGNYDCLPGGIGLGVPVALVDVGSFLDVWHRTQAFRLPYFAVRAARVGRKVIDEEICRVCGFDLRIENGKLTLGYFRAPLAGEAVTTWDSSVLLTEENDDGDRRPRVAVRLDTEFTAGAVVFKARAPGGVETESVFTDSSFPEFFGNADGYYEGEDQRVEIEAPGVRVDARGAEPEVLRHRAIQLLSRYRRPLMRIEVATDLSQEGLVAGSVLALEHAQIPDLVTGTRGVSGLVCRVLEKGALTLEEDLVGRHWTLIAYGLGSRVGRVCPSGRIASVAGSTATITRNRYTDPAARGLASSDGEAFALGDRLRLVTRGGLPIATVPAYQTIVALTATSVQLDGNFGGAGAFAAGTILEYVGRDTTTDDQAERFVHMADAATRTVGASTQRAWTYGEP